MNVAIERGNADRNAVKDLLALYSHPRMKEGSEESIDEIRRSRGHQHG